MHALLGTLGQTARPPRRDAGFERARQDEAYADQADRKADDEDRDDDQRRGQRFSADKQIGKQVGRVQPRRGGGDRVHHALVEKVAQFFAEQHALDEFEQVCIGCEHSRGDDGDDDKGQHESVPEQRLDAVQRQRQHGRDTDRKQGQKQARQHGDEPKHSADVGVRGDRAVDGQHADRADDCLIAENAYEFGDIDGVCADGQRGDDAHVVRLEQRAVYAHDRAENGEQRDRRIDDRQQLEKSRIGVGRAGGLYAEIDLDIVAEKDYEHRDQRGGEQSSDRKADNVEIALGKGRGAFLPLFAQQRAEHLGIGSVSRFHGSGNTPRNRNRDFLRRSRAR